MKLEDLKILEEKAKKATRGKYVLETPHLNSEEEFDRLNHGGWRTDTLLVVEDAYDPINEEFYERMNTPYKNRRSYIGEQLLFSEFEYRGPAQTHANADYLASLDPETVLKLIDLAKKGLGE